jgi:hypothetical protein
MVRSKGIRFTSPLAIGYADESKGPIFVRQHRAVWRRITRSYGKCLILSTHSSHRPSYYPLTCEWSAGSPTAFTGDEVATKLTRLLTENSFQERAQYWGDELRKAGGVSRAADLIRSILKDVR